jgi:protein ImuA
MNIFQAYAENGVATTLPPGFPALHAVHELRAPETCASHAAFAAILLSNLAFQMPVLWVGATANWYPTGLAWLGLDPARLLFAQAKDDAESLGALEVALNGGMAGVAEAKALSRLAARRLALAAKKGGGIGFLLRHAPRHTAMDSTAPATRWLITSAPSQAPSGPPGLAPGMSFLRAELLYAKGGQPGVFFLEMQNGETHGSEQPAAPSALALAGGAAPAIIGTKGRRTA